MIDLVPPSDSLLFSIRIPFVIHDVTVVNPSLGTINYIDGHCLLSQEPFTLANHEMISFFLFVLLQGAMLSDIYSNPGLRNISIINSDQTDFGYLESILEG